MTHFDVDTEQLHKHARSIGDVADQVSAIGGRLPSGLADLALGAFGQFLATGLQNAMTQVANTVTDASSSVAELGTGVVRTAAAYQHIDENSAAGLTEEFPG